jgi:hypothetical protein
MKYGLPGPPWFGAGDTPLEEHSGYSTTDVEQTKITPKSLPDVHDLGRLVTNY